MMECCGEMNVSEEHNGDITEEGKQEKKEEGENNQNQKGSWYWQKIKKKMRE